MSSPPSTDPAILARIAAAVGADSVTVTALARGVTHETLVVRAAEVPVAVLRLAPPRAGILPRHEPVAEARLLDLLAGSGIPVPRILAVDPDGATFGRPGFLMGYCHGRSTLTWEALRAEAGDGTDDDALVVLARLHALAPPAGWPDAEAPARHAGRDLEGVRRLNAQSGAAAPAALHDAITALAFEPPAPSGATIVHGDYRPANLMAAEHRVTGVLDWEMTTVGDPACDFGISTMREWGVWAPDVELLDRYVSLGGAGVDLVALRWWRALGYGKVVAFLACRAADGWDGGPVLGPWTQALENAVRAWHSS